MEVKGADDEARVIYDDDMEEWLSLAQERFQWLAPRAQSAGGTPELQVHTLNSTVPLPISQRRTLLHLCWAMAGSAVTPLPQEHS